MPAAGILGQKRSKYWRPILHSSKSPETSRKTFSEYIKNTQWKKFTRGSTPCPQGWGAPYPLGTPPISWAPWWPSGDHLLLYEVFRWEKIASHLLGRNSAATRRNLGGTNLGLRRSCSAGETSLRKGGNHHHRHHQRSSHREGVNLHQHLHQHHLLSNPSSSLVSNLSLKALDWYLWVASSVDYSLQLMLVGLFGGRSYVQILNAYQ